MTLAPAIPLVSHPIAIGALGPQRRAEKAVLPLAAWLAYFPLRGGVLPVEPLPDLAAGNGPPESPRSLCSMLPSNPVE